MACKMSLPKFRLYNWIADYRLRTKHNLSASGLPEPDMDEMGIDTSYESYLAHAAEASALFCARIQEMYGLKDVSVFPTFGGSEAIFLAYFANMGEKSSAVVPLPNYEPLFAVPAALGYSVKSDAEPSLGSVGANSLVALTDSNNPLGKTLETELLEKLSNSGATLYVDETFREFLFPDKPTSSLTRFTNFTVSNTMTKFYGLSRIRAGWIACSQDRMEAIIRAKRLVSGDNNPYSLWVAYQALRNRDRFVFRAKSTIATNLKLVNEFLDSTPGIEWSAPNAAPFGFVLLPPHVDSLKLCQKAAERARILIAPGEFFGKPGGFRLCFTSPWEELQESLEALTKFLRSELAA